MATEIKMPQLSDTMSAGKILSWKKKEGDAVNRGDILAEVETDKANLEIECFQQGTLLKIIVPAGSSGKVGEAIAIVGAAGESVAASPDAGRQAAAPVVEPTVPSPAKPAASVSSPPQQTVSTTPMVTTSHEGSDSDRVKASPLAKKVAQNLNVNLAVVTGSGPNGRIVRRDVEAAVISGPGQQAAETIQHTAPAARPPSAPSRPQSSSGPVGGTLVAMSRMRETIARRMQESVTQAPHFYVSNSINMREALKLREALKAFPEYKGISVNHLVIKAVGYGLAREPRVNCAVRDGQIFTPDQINIGVITAVEDGLLIPVVREVDKASLKDVVFEARAAVERARAGRPNSSDLSGGTFSISNMGMFDVENFTAIINPGQGAILAVSAVKEQPIVENGQVTVAPIMKVTLSVDHRIIDGVMGSTFLKHFKDALETPGLMLA